MKQLLAAMLVPCLAAAPAERVDPGRFERRILVDGCREPMQLEVRAGGDVYFAQRGGEVKLYQSATGRVLTLGTIPVGVFDEVGLMGMALDPAFDANRWAYFAYCPAENTKVVRVARFTLAEEALDLSSRTMVLEYPIDAKANHMGGALEFGPDGCLYIGTGDNSPNMTLPSCDQRPGRENFDAFRASGNTQDLRGKILRILPRPEGGYDLPPGNLFPRGTGGRPEILAMGCRNPYRFAIDRRTGRLYFGEVGPNIETRFGPNGYDEINVVEPGRPGNYGWPLFTGPNEPYRWYDFAKDQIGELFSAADPINPSRNNTGSKALPPPVPPLIWYPSGDSTEFPQLGSGARCAMAGPVFYRESSHDPNLKLPDHYDGCLFIYDWTRNWIKAVRLDAGGSVAGIEPFMPGTQFRKPIDLEIGADGTIYLAEYGDGWWDEGTAQITRLVYVRGNRAPVAVASAQVTAGREPLEVKFDAAASTDSDGDALNYSWSFGDAATRVSEASPVHTYHAPGLYLAELTVTDSQGASARSAIQIAVGNAPPRVRIAHPLDGIFFDWGRPVQYRLEVSDHEDAAIDPARTVLRSEYQTPRPDSARYVAPAVALMRSSTCFACHGQDVAGLGPAYVAIADKYRSDPAARDLLPRKILAGGSGTWGQVPMPPHPQHTLGQARQMVDWILSLAGDSTGAFATGISGTILIPDKPPPSRDGGVYILTGAYTDSGSSHAPPLTGQARVTLHARRKFPTFADVNHGVDIFDVFEGGLRQTGQFGAGDYLAYRTINLEGISRITLQYSAPGGRGGQLELRVDSRDGPLIGTFILKPTGGWHLPRQLTQTFEPSAGTHDLYLVARAAEATSAFNVDWMEFQR
jgi:cytochrome c